MTTINNSNKRKSKRLKARRGIAITPYGIGQITNLNRDGASFKCVEKRNFPLQWSMAIYDSTGQCLEQLRVKKIWEKGLKDPTTPSPFAMEIGVKFQNLSLRQEEQINAYMQQLLEGEG